VIPEEDLPPSWLRDYGDIEADISRMEEFAKKLNDEVTNNYAPHLPYVFDDMLTELPSVYTDFPELHDFRNAYLATAQDTSDNVYFYGQATDGFAVAADEVSKQYKHSDAFSAARVSDVETALDNTAAAAPQLPGVQPDGAPTVGEGTPPPPEGTI
jgi:hypothetical protein